MAIEGEILGVGRGKEGALEEGKGVFGERGIFAEELRAWWLVLLIFFRCLRN